MSSHDRRAFLAACAVALLLTASAARGDEVLAAVATNFLNVVTQLEPEFEAQTGHDLRLVAGSTGKLYAQIVNGAPFEVFLAADQERPARLVADGLALEDSRRIYAEGRLALWSPRAEFIEADGARTLRSAGFRRLAIANPELAPYGLAAREVILNLGLESELSGRLVLGENIGQTLALVATGNAELGFIALSQLGALSERSSGSHWIVPRSLHSPIRQDVVLLAHAADRPGARAFLDYLRTPAVKDRIRSHGYDVN